MADSHDPGNFSDLPGLASNLARSHAARAQSHHVLSPSISGDSWRRPHTATDGDFIFGGRLNEVCSGMLLRARLLAALTCVRVWVNDNIVLDVAPLNDAPLMTAEIVLLRGSAVPWGLRKDGSSESSDPAVSLRLPLAFLSLGLNPSRLGTLEMG